MTRRKCSYPDVGGEYITRTEVTIVDTFVVGNITPSDFTTVNGLHFLGGFVPAVSIGLSRAIIVMRRDLYNRWVIYGFDGSKELTLMSPNPFALAGLRTG